MQQADQSVRYNKRMEFKQIPLRIRLLVGQEQRSLNDLMFLPEQNLEKNLISYLEEIKWGKERDIKTEVKHLKREIKKEAKQKKTGKQPLWIEKCRDALGRTMMEHCYDDGERTWDVYTLVQIIHEHFLIFADQLSLSDHYAKDLLFKALKAQASRNTRAHGRLPTESEVMALIKNLQDIVGLFKESCGEDLKDGLEFAYSELEKLLREAQHLMSATDEFQTVVCRKRSFDEMVCVSC
jgi:hypothetical protein